MVRFHLDASAPFENISVCMCPFLHSDDCGNLVWGNVFFKFLYQLFWIVAIEYKILLIRRLVMTNLNLLTSSFRQAMHGGLFSEDGVKLNDIIAINRNRQPPESGEN